MESPSIWRWMEGRGLENEALRDRRGMTGEEMGVRSLAGGEWTERKPSESDGDSAISSGDPSSMSRNLINQIIQCGLRGGVLTLTLSGLLETWPCKLLWPGVHPSGHV